MFAHYAFGQRRSLPSGLILAAGLAALLAAAPAFAATSTWTGAGVNNKWSNNANWNVGRPLNGDTVAFGASSNTNIRADFSSYPATDPLAFNQPALRLQSFTFAAGAPSYTIELYYQGDSSTVYQSNLQLDGAGVVNSSGQPQSFTIDQSTPSLFNYPPASSITFNNSASAANAAYNAQGGTTFIQDTLTGQVAARSSGGRVLFNGAATAGTGTFVAGGGQGNGGGRARVEFHNNSTAASGTFSNLGGVNGQSFAGAQASGFGGETIFFDAATAGTAAFTNQGEGGVGGTGGLTTFTQNSAAASGVFVNNGSAIRDGNAGASQFTDNASAGNGNFTNSGGTAELAMGGQTAFFGASTAGHGTFANNGGTTIFALGGQTLFRGTSTAAFATITNAGPSGLKRVCRQNAISRFRFGRQRDDHEPALHGPAHHDRFLRHFDRRRRHDHQQVGAVCQRGGDHHLSRFFLRRQWEFHERLQPFRR